MFCGITIIPLAAIFTFAAAAQDAVFETDSVDFCIGGNGVSKTLHEKNTDRSWLDETPMAFAAVKSRGTLYPVSRLEKAGRIWHAGFGDSGVKVDFRITAHAHYIVFEVARLIGEGISELRFLQLQPACRENIGSILGIAWNKEFAVNLLGLSDRINVQASGNGVITASVFPEYGMEGQKVALIATRTSQVLDVVQEVERDFTLPSPRIGGQWAKKSRDVRTSYLFTDLTEANADETIRYAKFGGFKYLLIYSDTWSSSIGSYPINTRAYPHGEIGLKAAVDRCHAAGLKVGMHMMTSLISKGDPLVRPKPDARLLKDAQGTLAAPLDGKADEITVCKASTSCPTGGATYGSAVAEFDLQIDNEIIHCRSVGDVNGDRRYRCERGRNGTNASTHAFGAKVYHLTERYGSYLADLRTSLKEEIAERIAGLINRCGFDMIYFDGGESNDANGPSWYWVSQQQNAVCRRVRRDLLVQGSGVTHWSWHWFARGTCDDFAAVAPKQYLDYYKIANLWTLYTRNLLPVDLGWWGFLACEPDHPATTPDEVEFYATRMLAFDTPVALETTLAALKKNGRTNESLDLLSKYEKLRLSTAVTPQVRERLKTGEWHLTYDANRLAFVPVRYHTQRVALPADLHLNNPFGDQHLQFRLQAVPTLSPVSDPANVVLIRADSPLLLDWPAPKAPMPGALARRVEFERPRGDQDRAILVGPQKPEASGLAGKPLNLLNHRALAVRLRIDGPEYLGQGQCAVLNVQLESINKTYRDHYIDINFSGERTIVLREPNTDRMLAEFWPSPANYAFKAAMYDCDYSKISALNFRWMRPPKNGVQSCSVGPVEALLETERVITNLQLAGGDLALVVPASLRCGDYLECRADGVCRLFDNNGFMISASNAQPQQLNLKRGESSLSVIGSHGGDIEFTLIATGEPIRL
jgi:hypothetical protein